MSILAPLRSFVSLEQLFVNCAGWEIPAVLEQSLNSDLPGEIKALVMSNVYDTATGRYLLILQGSRLIGQYDARVAYGQDGVQVVWNRIIFPDASSIDLCAPMKKPLPVGNWPKNISRLY